MVPLMVLFESSTMLKKINRFLAAVLIPCLTLTGMPLTAQATLITTEQAMVTPAGDAHRDRVTAFFSRDDVRSELQAQGVSADEAIARVQAMSDTEVAQLADRVDEAPAGAGVVGVMFSVFLILLVTDILGFTKVFPFTRSVR